MIKKGDFVSIALIMANVIFVCLLVARGSFIAPDVAENTENNSSIPVTMIPDITLTVTARPSPTMTLAVNEGALLFAEIRSQPRGESSAPAVSPSPTPSLNTDDTIKHVIRPSYTPTPKATTIPSYRKASKARHKHQ